MFVRDIALICSVYFGEKNMCLSYLADFKVDKLNKLMKEPKIIVFAYRCIIASR